MIQQYVRIMLILGMIAVMCGMVSAATSIGATNENPSVGSPNACTAPCECISMNEAAQRWGAEGYEMCSKSICGQSANAMTQYYCIHQIGGSSSPAVTTCQAPCECLAESGAIAKWGTNGYTQCTKTTCGQESVSGGTVARYCFRQFGSTLLIGGGATSAATKAPAAGTQTTVLAPVQTQLQTLIQTQAQAPVATATPSGVITVTWPAPDAVPQRTPVGIATIIAAIGAVLVAAVVMRKE
jgi:hypothetical protein